jgi:hypothetical protein
MTNDATVEKLGELLRDNPNGILHYRDEIIGWLSKMDQEGHEGDRAFYLEAWNGTGRFTYDRIGRGTIDIEAACVSILGSIQPGPLLAYLERKAWQGAGDDGLIQRLQLTVWPNPPSNWRNVDRKPDIKARTKALGVFKRLARVTRRDDTDIHVLHFDDLAQVAFEKWRVRLERKLHDGNLHPAFEAHLAKYRSLLPSLALICYLADGGREAVGIEAYKKALVWCRYLETHAVRLYHGLTSADESAAHALGERIKRGDLKSPFKVRDVYRNGWSGLSTRESTQHAVDILCEHRWIKAEEAGSDSKGGRPTIQYQINPKVGFVSFVSRQHSDFENSRDDANGGFVSFVSSRDSDFENSRGFATYNKGLQAM